MIDCGHPREGLPDRRTGGTLSFLWGNVAATFTVGFSLFPAGAPWRCAEVFVNVTPSQSGLEKEIRDAGILASMALQQGAALDTLVAAVTHEEDGSASSLIGTALMLVRTEIARLAAEGPEATETPAPDGGPSGAGAGGAAGFVAAPLHSLVVTED